MVIEPIFEHEFAPQSYGFRPGRGCKDALRRVDELLKSGHVHVVDMDIKGYFDSIPHDKRLKLVRERIAPYALMPASGFSGNSMFQTPGFFHWPSRILFAPIMAGGARGCGRIPARSAP